MVEAFLPVGRFGPCPGRLREQFEGVVRRFRTGSRWREIPGEFGAWSTVYDRFSQWRDAGVFDALMDGMIAEAARRGQVDLSLVSVDSTVVRAHHDAAGRPRTRPDAVTADKAYSSRANRAHLRKRNIKVVIPEKVDQAATRYDKTPASFLAGWRCRAMPSAC